MGKLVEKLQQVGQSSGGMGFLGRSRSASPAARPAGVLISVQAKETAAIESAVKNGVDGVLISNWQPGSDLSAVKAAAGSAVWGVEYAGERQPAENALKTLSEAGAQFVVVAGSSPARLLFEEVEQFDIVVTAEMPKDDLALVLLRAENLLPAQVAMVDARLAASHLDSMTVTDFARLRLVCETLRFPTLVTLSGAPGDANVRTLVRLGVSGMVLQGHDVAAETLGSQVKALRDQLEKLPVHEGDRANVAIGGMFEGNSPTQSPRRRPATEPEQE